MRRKKPPTILCNPIIRQLELDPYILMVYHGAGKRKFVSWLTKLLNREMNIENIVSSMRRNDDNSSLYRRFSIKKDKNHITKISINKSKKIFDIQLTEFVWLQLLKIHVLTTNKILYTSSGTEIIPSSHDGKNYILNLEEYPYLDIVKQVGMTNYDYTIIVEELVIQALHKISKNGLSIANLFTEKRVDTLDALNKMHINSYEGDEHYRNSERLEKFEIIKSNYLEAINQIGLYSMSPREIIEPRELIKKILFKENENLYKEFFDIIYGADNVNEAYVRIRDSLEHTEVVDIKGCLKQAMAYTFTPKAFSFEGYIFCNQCYQIAFEITNNQQPYASHILNTPRSHKTMVSNGSTKVKNEYIRRFKCTSCGKTVHETYIHTEEKEKIILQVIEMFSRGLSLQKIQYNVNKIIDDHNLKRSIKMRHYSYGLLWKVIDSIHQSFKKEYMEDVIDEKFFFWLFPMMNLDLIENDWTINKKFNNGLFGIEYREEEGNKRPYIDDLLIAYAKYFKKMKGHSIRPVWVIKDWAKNVDLINSWKIHNTNNTKIKFFLNNGQAKYQNDEAVMAYLWLGQYFKVPDDNLELSSEQSARVWLNS